MTLKASQTSDSLRKGTQTRTRQKARVCKVRFLRPVKVGGRWYLAGQEASLSAKITEGFAKRGLVEKLTSSHSVSKQSE
jgi:hypothetical protein